MFGGSVFDHSNSKTTWYRSNEYLKMKFFWLINCYLVGGGGGGGGIFSGSNNNLMEGVYGGGGFFQIGRHDQIFESYSCKRETKKNLQIYSYSEFHVF